MEILLHLAQVSSGCTLQELSQSLGYSKSTVHRLVGTLERLEIIERAPRDRRYRVGPRMRPIWTGGPSDRADPRRVAIPQMLALRETCGETVTLHALVGTTHVVVEQCESLEEIRRILPVGQPVPLLAGATAKVLLAFLPPEQAVSLAAQVRTPDQAGPSRQELRDIQTLGYAYSLSERIDGASAISAPILDGTGRVWGALSISGPSFRFTAARAARTAPALMEAASRISTALGYVAPSRITERLAAPGVQTRASGVV